MPQKSVLNQINTKSSHIAHVRKVKKKLRRKSGRKSACKRAHRKKFK